MATTINDAFSAIDDYMAKNGKGQNYLAKKFIDLFEGVDSPLNVKNGAMVAVVDKFKKLGKSIDNFDTTVNSMGMKVRIMMAALKPTSFRLLNDSAERLSKKMDSYNKALKLPRLTSSAVRMNMPFPKKFEDAVYHIDKNMLLLRTTAVFTRNILSNISTMMAASTREKVLPSSTGSHSSRSLQLFSNNTSYNNSSTGDNKKGGWMSSIISNVLMGAAAFLGIGIIGKFMSNSPAGKVITSAIKSAFTFVGDSMSSFIKTGKFSKMIKDSFSSIRSIFTTVVGGITDYIRNNKNDIKKAFFDMGDAFSSEVWKPLKEGAKKAWNEKDYTTLITGGLGVVGIYKLITKLPLFKQVDKYLLRPIFSAVIKMPIMNIIEGIGSTVMPGVTSIMTKLGIVGIITGELYLIYDRLSIVKDKIGDIADTLKESSEIIQNNNNSMSKKMQKNIEKNDAIIQSLTEKQKLGTITQKEIEELAKANLHNSLIEIDKKRNQMTADDSHWLKGSIFTLLKSLPGESYFVHQRNEEYKKLDEQTKGITEYLNNFKSTSTKKVQDAEIIIPDKKDSHLFTKGGGPFDVALKDVNKKVDMIISVLSDGFSGLAQITAQSGGAVAQAVVASAGASKTAPATIIGGSNAIQRHRINTGRHIEFGQ